jgi:RND family efflux transporter MFP subunit
VVADTVAIPIEHSIIGVERIHRLVSRCSDGGKFTIQIHFAPRTDLMVAQVLVQNRVALALPLLPETVKNLGVSVKASSPRVLLFVTLFSPDARFDTVWISNYATIQIQDELARLPGVGEVSRFGMQDFGLRIWLDPDRLAARHLTAGDVIGALREQKVQVEVGKPGQPPTAPGPASSVTVSALGRAETVEQLADTVVKKGADGGLVRLKDVARVELGAASAPSFAQLDGKPVVALGIFPTHLARPQDVRAAVRERMEQLKRTFPRGIDYTLAADLTPSAAVWGQGMAPAYVVVEPVLPASFSAERTLQLVERCGEVLRRSEGVRHVLAVSENPFTRFREGPCLLALLDPADREPGSRERVLQGIRTRLDQVEGARLRLCGPGGYPVDLAVRGPEVEDVTKLAEQLVERLAQSGKLTDLSAGPKAAAKRQLFVDLDRATATAQGVALADLFATLQAYLGSVPVTDVHELGRTWQVQVGIQPPARDLTEDIKRLKVRNAKGQMIPLTSLVKIRTGTGPGHIDRLEVQPMREITANPARGVSLAEARWVCETLAEEARKELRLSSAYRLFWLRELPAPKPSPEGAKPTAPDAPPPEVQVGPPAVRAVTDYADFTGRTQAVSTVDLRARVTGYLEKALFKEGDRVKQGDVLFQIDPRPYQADLSLAEANLKQAEAERSLQEKTVARAQKLLAAAAMTREDYDQSLAALEKARATVAAVQAARDRARLYLDWTRVTAPINGRISRHLVDPGNLVNADTTLLGTIVSQDPMYVYFDLDERTALQLMRLARQGKGKPLQGGDTPALLGLADEKGYPRQGIVNFADNQLNPDTGTLRSRAVFPNADGMLLPGLFARIRLPVGDPHQALLVPDDAVESVQGQKFLYVVDDQNQVVSRRVHVGAVHDGLRVIEEGLKPGERVIISSLERLRPGMVVKPKVVALPDRPSPAP